MSAIESGRPKAPGAEQFGGIDYVEFYVGNVHNAVHFYRTAFGFNPVAYSGLETGDRDRVSFVLERGGIRLVVTGAVHPRGPVAEHVHLHGDGVKDIAFAVKDVEGVFHEAVRRGARPVLEPTLMKCEGQRICKATIQAFGDTVHSFIRRDVPGGPPLPDYQPVRAAGDAAPTGLKEIDHLAVVLDWGRLAEWVEFYSDALGFHQSHQEDVMTEYSAMNSKVVEDASGRIKFALLEPAQSKRRSQIEEYLDYYQGAGVQHVAFLSEDIVGSVGELCAGGIQFLQIPPRYYDTLGERVGQIEDDVSELKRLNILADRDRWGYLMQAFTKSFNNRPTNFFEIIQRKQARGFGSGNIKALFLAVEQEQAVRGNL